MQMHKSAHRCLLNRETMVQLMELLVHSSSRQDYIGLRPYLMRRDNRYTTTHSTVNNYIILILVLRVSQVYHHYHYSCTGKQLSTEPTSNKFSRVAKVIKYRIVNHQCHSRLKSILPIKIYSIRAHVAC